MRKNILLAAALALGISSTYAAEVEVKAKADAPKVEAEIKGDAERPREYKQEVRIETAVKPINKAHNIIGMEVKNRNDERLGEIKDLVVDLQSGKIAYAALAVGGFLGVGEKLIAVPTSALTPSERSNNILILDATRGEVVDAPGFASTNWPDPRSPELNESPLWRKNRGGAPQADTGKARLYTDANGRDKEIRAETKIERDNSARHTAIGRVKSINSKNVVIDTGAGRTETYSIGDKNIRSSDFKAGERVTIKYHNDNGKMVIDNIDR